MRAEEKGIAALSKVCEHVSHAISTPLGVALCAIEDIRAGMPLNKQDLEDAQVALEKIQRTVEEVRALVVPSGQEEAPTELERAVRATLALQYGERCDGLKVVGRLPELKVEELVLAEALAALVAEYLELGEGRLYASLTEEAAGRAAKLTIGAPIKYVATEARQKLFYGQPLSLKSIQVLRAELLLAKNNATAALVIANGRREIEINFLSRASSA